MTINVNLNGTNLVVEYRHTPAMLQTADNPGNDEAVNVVAVHSKLGDDLLGMFQAIPGFLGTTEYETLEAHRKLYADEYK
jgi:hypothetical protein